MKSPAFKIKDYVYHVTLDSPKGIVLDCQYSLRYDEWKYLVAFSSSNTTLAYDEDELSYTKNII